MNFAPNIPSHARLNRDHRHARGLRYAWPMNERTGSVLTEHVEGRHLLAVAENPDGMRWLDTGEVRVTSQAYPVFGAVSKIQLHHNDPVTFLFCVRAAGVNSTHFAYGDFLPASVYRGGAFLNWYGDGNTYFDWGQVDVGPWQISGVTNPSVWRQIALVTTGAENRYMAIYSDGIEVLRTLGSEGLPTGFDEAYFSLGHSYSGSDTAVADYFDFRIYNRAIGTDELREMYEDPISIWDVQGEPASPAMAPVYGWNNAKIVTGRR